jgi:DNA-binding transcriptional ArsR family regulator
MHPEEKEELLWRILKTLDDISGKIDRMISILEFSQKRELESRIKEAMGKSEIRKEIYELCDGTRSVREIARILGKSVPHVSIQISELEKTGIVKAKRVGKEKYYQKVL